jgi:hypothetical protein
VAQGYLMGSEDEASKKAGQVIGEMGRERLALRAKKTAVVLLGISAFLCLVSALLSLSGYLPYAVGPSVVLIVASVGGFATSIFEARRP